MFGKSTQVLPTHVPLGTMLKQPTPRDHPAQMLLRAHERIGFDKGYRRSSVMWFLIGVAATHVFYVFFAIITGQY